MTHSLAMKSFVPSRLVIPVFSLKLMPDPARDDCRAWQVPWRRHITAPTCIFYEDMILTFGDVSVGMRRNRNDKSSSH